MLSQLGPYKIEKMLGRGGMGAVYAGVHQATGERAAIKVLSPTLADDPGFQERFKAEIETLKQLRHPNIVQLFGYGEHDGHMFYSMELVDGRNLQDELQAGRRFDWREACRIGIEICQGLKHAHDVGVIHRDLKPANLLITKEGQIKLSDFGIARLFGMTQLTGDGGVLGTADYMAPEQADGRPVSTRCDMYSLGSVLFALLARRPPFGGPSLPEVLHALKYDPAPSVRRFAPHVPEEFDNILTQLLDKEPQNRVATALVLSNRLKAMLHALADDRTDQDTHVGQDFELRLEEPVERPTRISEPATPTSRESAASEGTSVPSPTRGMTTDAEPERPAAASLATAAGSTRHFTVVDTQATTRRENIAPPDEEGVPIWVIASVGLGLVAILGGLSWYFTLPASAEVLYGQIRAAAEDNDPTQLAKAETQMDQFLANYSGHERYDEVRGYREELELQRFQRRLDLRSRRLRGANTLLPVEQAYLDAISHERAAPEVAAERLQAIIDVYGTDPNASHNIDTCVKIARRQLAVLNERLTRSREVHGKAIAERLDQAQALVTEDPATSRQICEGIIALYADKPWAAESVSQARELLTELKK